MVFYAWPADAITGMQKITRAKMKVNSFFMIKIPSSRLILMITCGMHANKRRPLFYQEGAVQPIVLKYKNTAPTGVAALEVMAVKPTNPTVQPILQVAFTPMGRASGPPGNLLESIWSVFRLHIC